MAYNILDSRDVDQTYNPESENAQSGIAVNEALTTVIETEEMTNMWLTPDTEPPYMDGVYEVLSYQISPHSNGFVYYIGIEIGIIHCNYKEEIPGLSIGSKIYVEFGEMDAAFDYTINKLIIKVDKYVTREKFDKTIKNSISNYIDYEITNNEAVITYCEKFISGDHIIPETIDGYPVTDIGRAFEECYHLTGITIPGTIKTVGGSAFYECNRLISVIISEGVTSLEKYSFENCSDLRFVVIPESLTNIDEYVFTDCYNITDVYYAGSEEQWNNITIGEHNENLTNTTIHFNQAPAKKADVIEKVNPITLTSITDSKLEANKVYRLSIGENTSFVLPTMFDKTRLNSIELQITLSNYENITIDLGATKYFGDIPELNNGSYIIYYEHDGIDWCVGALEIVGA